MSLTEEKTAAERMLEEGIQAWENEEAEKAKTSLHRAQELGSMKAGRYLGMLYLQEAAQRGDITSEIILGMMCEYGLGMKEDPEQAKKWYTPAIADNHRDREGFMLAAGADLGMGRILLSEKQEEEARKHLDAAAGGGRTAVRREAQRIRDFLALKDSDKSAMA